MKCHECSMKNGCYALCKKHPYDVMQGPCNKAMGYSEPMIFWAAPFLEWKKVQGTTVPPNRIEWAVITSKDPKTKVVIFNE